MTVPAAARCMRREARYMAKVDVWTAEHDLALPDGRVLRYAGRSDAPPAKAVRTYRAGWCDLQVDVSGDGGPDSVITVRLDYEAIADGGADALADVQAVADLFYGEGRVHAIWGLAAPGTVTLVPSGSWGSYAALLGIACPGAPVQ